MSDTATEPEQVQADTPAKPAKAKKAPAERKPRTPKDPRDFGEAPTATPGFKLPAELPNDKTALREVIRNSGVMPVKAASYMTPREIKAALKNEFPFVARPYVDYRDPSTEDGTRKVNTLQELIALAGDRKEKYAEMERVRAKVRDAERNAALGELAERFPGRTTDARIGRLKARLESAAPWVPVGPAAKIERGSRVYDIDGTAGRTTFYPIAPKSDLKVDGTPKASAVILQMSPMIYDELVKGDTEIEALIEVPEGFNVAVKKERAPKDPNAPKKTRKKKATNSDILAEADEAAGAEPTESLDDAVGATVDQVEIPDL